MQVFVNITEHYAFNKALWRKRIHVPNPNYLGLKSRLDLVWLTMPTEKKMVLLDILHKIHSRMQAPSRNVTKKYTYQCQVTQASPKQLINGHFSFNSSVKKIKVGIAILYLAILLLDYQYTETLKFGNKILTLLPSTPSSLSSPQPLFSLPRIPRPSSKVS